MKFAPDAARRVAAIEGKLTELERTVRRGKAAPNLRDLDDADMAKAADGDVPVYSTVTGTYRPGGGRPRAASLNYNPSGVLAVNTWEQAGDATNWTVEADAIGLTIEADGGIALPGPGSVVVTAYIKWGFVASAPYGNRQIQLSLNNVLQESCVPAAIERDTIQSISACDHMPATARIYLIFRHQDSSASVSRYGELSILFWAD